MGIMSLICLFVWLVLIPFACGLLFSDVFGRCNRGAGTVFLCGHLFMIAVFQVIYIPFLIYYNHFQPLVYTYAGIICAFAVFSVVIKRKDILILFSWKLERKVSAYILWGVALLLIGLQLYKAVFYQYPDHDDAFYAVVSAITNTNNDMYLDVPYTGETSSIDVRHAFSGHPIFISFLARVSGIHSTIVAHTVYPPLVIVLSYLIMKKIGDVLLSANRDYVPVFLSFVALMQIFGNATIYTSATFFLTRTSQGKAVIGSVAVPAAVLGIVYIGQVLSGEKQGTRVTEYRNRQKTILKKKEKPWFIWIYMVMVFLAGSYCSAMAMFLIPLMAGGVAFLYMLTYRKPRVLVLCVGSMLPMALLGIVYYLVFGTW
ncbi:MAG: hypothetical protein IJ485_05740 [Lachnospiraceae bacterium]|nr:hypothetical protein [Lachnospiraceae bacterium]